MMNNFIYRIQSFKLHLSEAVVRRQANRRSKTLYNSLPQDERMESVSSHFQVKEIRDLAGSSKGKPKTHSPSIRNFPVFIKTLSQSECLIHSCMVILRQ